MASLHCVRFGVMSILLQTSGIFKHRCSSASLEPTPTQFRHAPHHFRACSFLLWAARSSSHVRGTLGHSSNTAGEGAPWPETRAPPRETEVARKTGENVPRSQECRIYLTHLTSIFRQSSRWCGIHLRLHSKWFMHVHTCSRMIITVIVKLVSL